MAEKLFKDLFLEGHVNLSLIPDNLLKDKKFIIELIAKEPYIYLILDEDFRSDIDICKTTILNKFDMFKYFPPDIKVNREIITSGIKNTNCFFEIFFEEENEKLLTDREFIKYCVNINGIFIHYLNSKMLLDEELFILGIKENNLVLNLFKTEVVDNDKFLSLVNYRDPEIFFALQERIQKCIFRRYFINNKKRKLVL